MALDITLPSSHLRRHPTTTCAQCGSLLLRPEWSEYRDDRHALHLWECLACGHAFETSVVRLEPAA